MPKHTSILLFFLLTGFALISCGDSKDETIANKGKKAEVFHINEQTQTELGTVILCSEFILSPNKKYKSKSGLKAEKGYCREQATRFTYGCTQIGSVGGDDIARSFFFDVRNSKYGYRVHDEFAEQVCKTFQAGNAYKI